MRVNVAPLRPHEGGRQHRADRRFQRERALLFFAGVGVLQHCRGPGANLVWCGCMFAHEMRQICRKRWFSFSQRVCAPGQRRKCVRKQIR